MAKTERTTVELNSCYADAGDGGLRVTILRKDHPRLPPTFHLRFTHGHNGTRSEYEVDLPLTVASWFANTLQERLPEMLDSFKSDYSPYGLNLTTYKDGVKTSVDPATGSGEIG